MGNVRWVTQPRLQRKSLQNFAAAENLSAPSLVYTNIGKRGALQQKATAHGKDALQDSCLKDG
jgi:hypothetical protein